MTGERHAVALCDPPLQEAHHNHHHLHQHLRLTKFDTETTCAHHHQIYHIHIPKMTTETTIQVESEGIRVTLW